MKQLDIDIDFVIPWVDGSDPEWIKSFNIYADKSNQIDIDKSAERYRDYGLLKYWFRGVEKFAPWVRKIHFITCGQKPEWLNIEHPKLNFVQHSDYINKEYLPAFSSNSIEVNMHKISGLSEHFVYFNDDFFIIKPLAKEFFFSNGLPNDCAVQNIISCNGFSVMMGIVANNLFEINKNFTKKNVILNNFSKWFNVKYGKDNLKNIILSKWKRYVGFINPHFPQPFLKSQIEDCWMHCGEKLESTSKNRFRTALDVNQWLFRYWHICNGKFVPSVPYKDKKYFQLGNDSINEICEAVYAQKYSEICINDGSDENFVESKEKLCAAFDAILPEKSKFEV